jgi:replicative DNA helicase
MSKEISEFIKDYDYIPLAKAIDKAQHFMDKIRSGEMKPIQTSLKKEQEMIGGYYFGDQVVIAGRTGMGKSAKMFHDMMDFVNPVLNPTWVNNIVILLDSYEMADWRTVLRLISREGNVEVKALLDYQQRLTEEKFQFLRAIAEKFRGFPIYVTNKPVTAEQWEENKKQIQGKFPTKRIINIFDHTRLGIKKDEKKEEELITSFMIKGVHLKNNFEMLNFFLSQMNRNIETALSRDRLGTHLPIASDIFGSDAVFQCADVVMALHRPGLYGLTVWNDIPTGKNDDDPDKEDDLLIECVLKQREGWTGNLLLKHQLKYNKVEDYPDAKAEEKAVFDRLLKDDF